MRYLFMRSATLMYASYIPCTRSKKIAASVVLSLVTCMLLHFVVLSDVLAAKAMFVRVLVWTCMASALAWGSHECVFETATQYQHVLEDSVTRFHIEHISSELLRVESQRNEADKPVRKHAQPQRRRPVVAQPHKQKAVQCPIVKRASRKRHREFDRIPARVRIEDSASELDPQTLMNMKAQVKASVTCGVKDDCCRHMRVAVPEQRMVNPVIRNDRVPKGKKKREAFVAQGRLCKADRGEEEKRTSKERVREHEMRLRELDRLRVNQNINMLENRRKAKLIGGS